MEKRHREAIQKNFCSLLAQTDLNVMVSALYERGVFSELMIEPFKNPRVDDRSHKRNLYLQLTRRGPQAFGHLIDTLWENGHWSLVKDLDPDGEFHHYKRNTKPKPEANDESKFISIRAEKKQKEMDLSRRNEQARAAPVSTPPWLACLHLRPVLWTHHFNIAVYVYYADIKVYEIGSGLRVMLIFTYNEFEAQIEETRHGAEVDCHNLKYLFTQLGFKVLAYPNLKYKETVDLLARMPQSLRGAACVFVVVSSHGYARHSSADFEFRVSDARLLSFQRFVDYFNNDALPDLVGVPKVFIFQTCRGSKEMLPSLTTLYESLPMPDASRTGARVSPDSSDYPDAVRDGPPRQSAAAALPVQPRRYSDILIAHSTVPGYVSRRDPLEGSWYIQTLCEVFAKHAAEYHIEDLFKIVDEKMNENHKYQTSSVDKWGFNKRLYLRPGLIETNDHRSQNSQVPSTSTENL
ncbi:death regulator Nedd2-like caspase [Aphomia sociella]